MWINIFSNRHPIDWAKSIILGLPSFRSQRDIRSWMSFCLRGRYSLSSLQSRLYSIVVDGLLFDQMAKLSFLQPETVANAFSLTIEWRSGDENSVFKTHWNWTMTRKSVWNQKPRHCTATDNWFAEHCAILYNLFSKEFYAKLFCVNCTAFDSKTVLEWFRVP